MLLAQTILIHEMILKFLALSRKTSVPDGANLHQISKNCPTGNFVPEPVTEKLPKLMDKVLMSTCTHTPILTVCCFLSLCLSGERQHRVHHGQRRWWASSVRVGVSESPVSSKATCFRGTRAQPVVRTCNGPKELRHPGAAGIGFRGGAVGGAWGISVHGSHKVRWSVARLRTSISRLFIDVPSCRGIRK